MRSDSLLERPQEINDVLLLLSSQPKETFDDLICLAAIALVISDGFHQVSRPSIMEEEDALSDAPERSGSELVGAGTTLRDSVGEAFAHVVDEKVRVKIRRLIGKRSARVRRILRKIRLCSNMTGICSGQSPHGFSLSLLVLS